MSTDAAIHDSIDRAATSLGSVWPLHSFVTANPLAGFEDRPFHEAVAAAGDLLGGDGYPDPETFRHAWDAGRIDPETLDSLLAEYGYEADPETLLDRMAAGEGHSDRDRNPADERVDAVLTKWLSAFLDQGRAEWSMPDRNEGFYAAWRSVAPHDGDVPGVDAPSALPPGPVAAIKTALSDVPPGRWEALFEFHLAALPGWTGLVKRRAEDEGPWQSAYPITLVDYLAVRLTLVDRLDATLEPDDDAAVPDEPPLRALFLRAWEASYREEVVGAVTDAAGDREDTDQRPAAQLVFCIDTRSEIIRRHLEAAGDYETHGYAGFFGVPMRYDGADDAPAVDACPPVLDAQHRVEDHPADDAREGWTSLTETVGRAAKRLKTNAATAFSFVEGAGGGYGAALGLRTLLPEGVARARAAVDDRVPDDHEVCEPTLDRDPDGDGDLPLGLTLDEKVEYAATAFDLMGWEQFARLVVFTGHASQTANNPFDSSLDCGACAGNPGGPSARVLASICNDPEVRAELAERGHEIPADTHFLAAEHNTTTDAVTLFDDGVPESHSEDLERLRADLATAQREAATERLDSMGVETEDPVETVRARANDWAETRPEWGLAGNAAFVVGPRELTADLDLDGRAFLHSYDPATDPDGEALEAIMAGPMVVTQWINSQYYFATVDTSVYGSGSKVTQNPVGNVGVYQGNGGDLLTGLPLQSVAAAADEPYHQPIRLSTVIHAPLDRVTDVLADHDELATLLDNGWLSLTVVDPQQDDRAFHYDGELGWEPATVAAATGQQPTAADD